MDNTLRWLGPGDKAPVAAATTFLYDFDSMKRDLTRWTFASGHALPMQGRLASRNGARVFIAPASGTLSPCAQEPLGVAKGCKITGGLLLGPILSGPPTPTPAPRPPVRPA